MICLIFETKKERRSMDKFILGCIVISYSILITIQISMSKELLEIKKILWKVAKNESLELAFKKTKQKSTYPKDKI